MKILSKGCEIVAVQNEKVHSIKSEHYLENEDVELYIFQDESVKSIEYIHYKDILKKGVKKISGLGGLEIVITQCLNPNQLNMEQNDQEFNCHAVRKWLNFKSQNQLHQFNQLYRTLKDLQNAQATITQVKQNDTIEAFQSCVDLSVLSNRNDSLKELEQQYVKGQMKWAQIDMENAELATRIRLLQVELQQRKQEINKLKYQYENNAYQLLQSKQQLGDVINQAIEIGDSQILAKLGL
ncbi:unnamed protein product (macronuclear) [Paramecium tetraurelia]|uniref:Uncharacterized protein n=1 Tax=Paramecium tetraurelia TaxID=5888 RepID=A0BJF4_PARTE|nr:uncharacterized protein GSPATT00029298001 [Paramecium tetraurelia]CAK58671.1 unnamed protein product [Paramecium tetraurelia]|eukprot:XP_001426069.1 hypothetical protein (macronuclear) [Paramecium tetraurelia strain d4-2]